MDGGRNWPEYHRLAASFPPRPILIKALDLFKGYKGNVVDLGSEVAVIQFIC